MKVFKSSQSSITIEHRVKEKQTAYDISLFVPTEMPLQSLLGHESDFYTKNISFRHNYGSSQILLPLLKSQITEIETENKKYRSNLSLFAYHFVRSVEFEALNIPNLEEEEQVIERTQALCATAEEILFKFRRIEPQDQNHHQFYHQVDNYLSWSLEQQFLKLGWHLPKSKNISASRKMVVAMAQAEKSHRDERAYNSSKTVSDPVRLSNKMKLLQRIIESPVVVGEKSHQNGTNVNRGIKAITTAFVMLIVLYATKFIRLSYEHLSLSFILIICGVYGAREIFKDELKQAIWSYYNRNRPKWTIYLTDNYSHKRIGKRSIYLDYAKPWNLPQATISARRNHSTTTEQVLHLRVQSYFQKQNFNPSFHLHEERIEVDLAPLCRLAAGASHSFYEYNKDNKDNISHQRLEKRITLNLVIGEMNKEEYKRYKIIINKNSIISIEQVNA